MIIALAPITEEQYTDLLESMLNAPWFDLAWRSVGEGGMGSEESGRQVTERLTSSEYHMDRLTITAEEIARHVDQNLLQPEKPDTNNFLEEVLSELLVVASVFFITGVMVGSLAAAIARKAEGNETGPRETVN